MDAETIGPRRVRDWAPSAAGRPGPNTAPGTGRALTDSQGYLEKAVPVYEYGLQLGPHVYLNLTPSRSPDPKRFVTP